MERDDGTFDEIVEQAQAWYVPDDLIAELEAATNEVANAEGESLAERREAGDRYRAANAAVEAFKYELHEWDRAERVARGETVPPHQVFGAEPVK